MRKLPGSDLLTFRGAHGFAVIERPLGEHLWRVVFRYHGVSLAEWCRSRPPEVWFACRADARLFAEAVLERGVIDGLQPVLLEGAR